MSRGKDFMKKFCESLREHAMEIINFGKKKMKLLANEQQKLYENTKVCYICKDKKYRKNTDHCHYTREYRGAAHSIYNLKYSVPKKIPILACNESNYDYNFIVKELIGELKDNLIV